VRMRIKRPLSLQFTGRAVCILNSPMERPRSATEDGDNRWRSLEIIRRMAVRHGDDQIASVFEPTRDIPQEKGNGGIRKRVATARRKPFDSRPKARP